MSKMFKNYPQPDTYIPDNRPQKPLIKELVISTGSNCIHTFLVPAELKDLISNITVVYRLGLEDIITKVTNANEILDHENDVYTFSVTLSYDETNLFANTYLAARCQVYFNTIDNDVITSPIFDIKVIDGLKPADVPPVPVMVGFGYTED